MSADAANVVELVRVRSPRVGLDFVRRALVTCESAFGPRRAKLYVARTTKFWHHRADAVRLITVIPKHPAERSTAYYAGPRGERVDVVEDWRAFFEAAEARPDLCGPYGLSALEAAHGDNCLHPASNTPWSAHSWSAYTHALNRNLARLKQERAQPEAVS